MVVIRPQKEERSSPSLVLSSGELVGGDGVTRAARSRWRRMRRFISAFSESGEDEEARPVRRRIRRSGSAFTTSDMVGEGVESREETRMGEEGRDMIVGLGR